MTSPHEKIPVHIPLRDIYQKVGKRLLDLGIVVSLAPFLLPVITLVAVVVRVKIGRPILFCQIRAGQHGRGFLLYKFRTMTAMCDERGHLAPDELRLTRLGRFLRASSLDELPGLWNVVRGDMSLVGPRPLLMEYLTLYSSEQARRHDVKPGITGWAQVKGRNSIPWDEKFTFDILYVRNCSMWLDLKILWQTFFQVFKRTGITAEGHATMPAFRGLEKSSNSTFRDAA